MDNYCCVSALVAVMLAAPVVSAQDYSNDYSRPDEEAYSRPYSQTSDDPSAYRHDGFYFDYSLGGGYFHSLVHADRGAGLESDVTGGMVASQLVFGGTPARGLVIGGGTMSTVVPNAKLETNKGGKSEDVLISGSIGIFSVYYPYWHKGLHVMGHLGFATLSYGHDVAEDELGIGFSAAAGVGYDWWIGKQWSVGVLGRFQYTYAGMSVDTKDDSYDSSLAYHALAPALLVSITCH